MQSGDSFGPNELAQLKINENRSGLYLVSQQAAGNPLFTLRRWCFLPGSDTTYMFSHGYILFEIKRSAAYYAPAVLIPTLVISLLMSVVFVLKAGDDEKIGVSLTVLLSYFVVSFSLSSMLPTTSENIPYLYFFYGYQTSLSTLATFAGAIIRNWAHQVIRSNDGAKKATRIEIINTAALIVYFLLCGLGYAWYFLMIFLSPPLGGIATVEGENATCALGDLIVAQEYIENLLRGSGG